MDFIEKIELIKKFDYYIQNQCTGKPALLARKLGVSERKVFRLIETIVLMGGDLEYCSNIESYRYKKSGCLQLGFEEHYPENISSK